jgi:hypothetical protein
MSTSASVRVLAACVIDACQNSISPGVTASSAIVPKRGSSSEPTIDR